MELQPINTALLSYGMSGEVFHGPLLKAHPGFFISKVYQRSSSKRATHGLPVTHSLEAVMNDPAVELVFVNTPNDSHYDYAMEALKAGKHVVVEKPFTVTAEEADALIAFARQQKKKLTVYQNRRWDGGFLTIRRILDQNLLGRIVEFELHYDRYRNYIEAGTWKEKDQRGTGILYNLGSHMLDQVLVLFGAPKSIDARMGIQRTGGEVIDYYDIRLQYDGLNVIVKSSYLVREAGPMYRVNGTSGSFVKNGIDPQEQALKEKLVPGGPGWGTEPREWWGRLNTEINGLHVEGVVETIPGNYPAFYQNLYEAIRLDKPLAVNPEQSRDVIRLIEAAIESNRTQAAVTFAP